MFNSLETFARRLLDELYTQFLERAPRHSAMMRAVAGDHQVEALRNVLDRRDLELGAAVRQVADDAIHPRPAAGEHDGGHDHGVAARRKTLFEAEVQGTSLSCGATMACQA